MRLKLRMSDEEWQLFCEKVENPSEKLRELALMVAYGDDVSPLDQIMDVEEAAEKWGFKPGTIKNLCADEKSNIKCRKVSGGKWILEKYQTPPVRKRGGNKEK